MLPSAGHSEYTPDGIIEMFSNAPHMMGPAIITERITFKVIIHACDLCVSLSVDVFNCKTAAVECVHVVVHVFHSLAWR